MVCSMNKAKEAIVARVSTCAIADRHLSSVLHGVCLVLGQNT
jgi:hypothetical protein